MSFKTQVLSDEAFDEEYNQLHNAAKKDLAECELAINEHYFEDLEPSAEEE